MFLLPQGLFECCSSTSSGKPEFLEKEKLVSARPASNLQVSSSGTLDLYFQRWESDRRQRIRAVVFIHHGETEHATWYNVLAVRLASLGCMSLAMDAQGFGQSDGARGYFETFEEVKDDFIGFVKSKWLEVVQKSHGEVPGLVFVAKGFGALLLLHALPEIKALAQEKGVMPVLLLLSPGLQFNSFIGDQGNVSCGLNSSQCASQPLAQCARAPMSLGPSADGQTLEYLSRWFPKMIVTDPVDPDMVCRDPQAIDRMSRDALVWRQGYRARVLAEILQEQCRLLTMIEQKPDAFACPAMILHGSCDKLYSAKGSLAFHRLWCQNVSAESVAGTLPVLKIYDGAYHQLLNEPNRDEIIRDIIAFVLSGI